MKPAADPELLATLPPILRAVVKALGFVRAREFLREHGGVPVMIPKYKTAFHLSRDEMDCLRKTLAPHLDAAGRVTLPKCDKLLALARNAAIVRDSYKKSITTQARAYCLSSRQILNIRRKGREDTPQGALF